MGVFGSKEWSEVYNNGSPGSPEDQDKAMDPRPRGVVRVDPRSISDDVERTPIQVDKTKGAGLNQEAQETPTGIKTKLDRFKAAIDPRSPSGLPRTPILVQDKPEEVVKDCDEADVEDDAPKRGAITKPMPPTVAKLNLDDHEDDEEPDKEEKVDEEQVPEVEKPEQPETEVNDVRDEEDVQKEMCQQTEEQALNSGVCNDTVEDIKTDCQEMVKRLVEEATAAAGDDENKTPVATTPGKKGGATSGKSLPRVMDISGDENECRSPLLIENDVDVFKNKPRRLSSGKKRTTPTQRRTPFGIRNENVMATEEATRMMKDVSLTSMESPNEDSLVI